MQLSRTKNGYRIKNLENDNRSHVAEDSCCCCWMLEKISCSLDFSICMLPSSLAKRYEMSFIRSVIEATKQLTIIIRNYKVSGIRWFRQST
jgi:hypothetical protein